MFYIYEHIRPDTQAVFYVGKGSEKRMHSKHRRNAYWNNVVRKAGGFIVREVCKHKDEELIFLAEQERIDQLKRLGVQLANLTIGGEGTSGLAKDNEWKSKLADSAKRQWSDADLKAKMSAKIKEAHTKPETKLKMKLADQYRKQNFMDTHLEIALAMGYENN